jgi:hypothetical protein
MADYASKGTLKSGKQLLLEFANDESIPQALRISAAMAHAKYEPAYLPTKVDYPPLNSPQDVQSCRQDVIQREGRQELDTETASMALARLDAVEDSMRADAASARADAELKLKQIEDQNESGRPTVYIQNSPGHLPGTHIIPPSHIDYKEVLNGHEASPVIDHAGPEPQRYYRGQPVKDPEP